MKNTKSRVRIYCMRGDIHYIDFKKINKKENEIIFIPGTPSYNNLGLVSTEQKLLLLDIIGCSDKQRLITCLTDDVRTIIIPLMYHNLIIEFILEWLRR